MADDLNVLLKAELDVNATAKQINIQLEQLENKCKELGIDIDLDGIFKNFNDVFNKLENSISQITKSFKNIKLDGKFDMSIDKLYDRLKQIRDTVGKDDLVDLKISTDENGNINKAILSYEELGRTVKETMTLTKDGDWDIKLDFDDNIKKAEKFNDTVKQTQQQLSKLTNDINIKSDSALWNFTDKLDEQSFTGLKSGINTVKAELLALSKIDIIDETSLKEVKNRMSEISNEYDSIIKNAQLDKKVNDYINQQKKEQSDLADYIEKKQREIYLLEEKIFNLNKTKGLNNTDYDSNFVELKTLLSSFGEGNVPLDEQKKKIESIIISTKDLINTNSKDLDLLYKKEDLYEKINSQIKSLENLKLNYDINDSFKLNIDNEIENLNKLKTNIEQELISTKEATIETKKFDTSLKGMSAQAKATSDATAKLGDRLKKAFQYFTFYDALQMGKRAVKEMIDVIFELDDALIELQKVSNLSGESLNSFTRQAYKLGSEISKSGKQVIEASTQFARAGFDESELLPLAETALKLTSIGDGLTNVSESANTLIAVMRGFGKGTSEVVSIMDAINNVSNNASVNFNDVTMALQRMSGTMNASGIDLQKSIGLFTALNEVMRNTEISSTAINSISMRMRGLSEDGEAIDGLSPKLQKMFKDIAKIDITDSTGQVEDLYTILGKLSPVWSTLTTNQKQYIAQESAG